MSIALPSSYVPICVFSPFLYLFHNVVNIIGVSDPEYISEIDVRLLQCTDLFKADMNSDIPLQTAAIFFSDELLSETGYWLGVRHG